MKMEQWIEQQIDKIKKDIENHPDTLKIPDYTLGWIASMLESAWSRGRNQGSNEAYENVQKWREETNE
ncbi:hypothetical protein [Paenibacillus prosopidis]|uniref:Uncharacterized protein n=1 Tax=Paenibacillus prosopidis TaxID=630520 RepID=A0A368VXF3_9BACL|nr:hypothetical protein [Paenibacillus prosopidis]RCW44232.1 hypothetical protein DFP97_11296 [Paenibacillus prosopidis]